MGAMAISPDGKMLYLPGPPRYARKLMRIGTDGSVPANAFTTRLTTHADNGWLYLACSPDGKTLYMAGAMAGYMGDDARCVARDRRLGFPIRDRVPMDQNIRSASGRSIWGFARRAHAWHGLLGAWVQ